MKSFRIEHTCKLALLVFFGVFCPALFSHSAAIVIDADSTSGQTPAAVTTVYLVRHAEKDTSPPDNPPLTAAGKARAEELARVLGQTNIKTIISSQFARTQQTAAPLAQRLSVTVTTLPIGMDPMNPREISPASIQAIVDKIKAQNGGEVLVVGHSNTVPEVIKKLDGDSAPIIDEKEFDDLFIVTLFASAVGRGKARVAHLKYGASK
jgi:phosphohistidine phosphatase SixA